MKALWYSSTVLPHRAKALSRLTVSKAAWQCAKVVPNTREGKVLCAPRRAKNAPETCGRGWVAGP